MRSTWDFPMIFRTYGKRMSQQTRNPLVPRTAILLSENAANCLRPTSEAWRSEPGSRTLVLTAGTSQQWQCPDPPSISGSSVPTVGLGHVGVLLARSWDLGSAWGPRMIGLLEVPLPESSPCRTFDGRECTGQVQGQVRTSHFSDDRRSLDALVTARSHVLEFLGFSAGPLNHDPVCACSVP
jgi:hypothetical protein